MADALHRASALWRFAVTPNGKLPFPDPFPVRILPHPRIETKKNPNTGFFFVSAPAAGFEPATKGLHVLLLFPRRMDYIISIARMH